MARTISKNISSATIFVLDPSKEFELDENGMPKPNVLFHADGIPSANRARLLAQKFCNSKNVMVVRIDVDETKLRVDPDTFIARSYICEDGKAYGREYVTQTFKITYIYGFYMDTDGMKQFSEFYSGETTDNKLLNFAREKYGQTAIITNKTVIDERRYMTRDEYLALAR